MKVFCYGTLKRDFPAHYLMGDSKFLGEATTQSRFVLYDHGGFPGLAETEGDKGCVHGELYDVSEAVLKDLDRYEGVSHGLFRRGEVELIDGSTAMAYFYNRETDYSKIIPSGEWS